jgi:hypothetical protein
MVDAPPGRVKRIANNKTVARRIERLHAQHIRSQFRLILVPGRPPRSVGEHRAIVEALAARSRRRRGRDARPPCAPGAGTAAHIKLIFPEDGQAEPAMPQPDGPRPTRIRTYTPRRFDPTVPELDVEFVLHGDGPASSWGCGV